MKKLLLLGVVGVVSLLFISSLPLQDSLIADDPKSIEPFVPKWYVGLKWEVERKSEETIRVGLQKSSAYTIIRGKKSCPLQQMDSNTNLAIHS